MRTLLRSIRSGEYLQSPESWTSLVGAALDFRSIPRAIELVRRRGLRDMELVLAEEPAPITAVPIAKLAYSQPLFRDERPGEAPRGRILEVKAPEPEPVVPAHRPRRQTRPKLARARPANREPRPRRRKPANTASAR